MPPINFTIYWKEIPAVRVWYDAAGMPQFEALHPQYLPVLLYGMDGRGQPNAERLDRFFADRCFPPTRQNASELLHMLGLSLYQPKLICRKTHGVVAHDHFWIRYDDDPEEISYAELMHQMAQAVHAKEI